MNPTDKQALMAELAAIQSMFSSIDSLIKTAAGQGSVPAAAVATLCGVLQSLSETSQKALEFLGRVIDKV
jgi:hypothetical protein